MLLAIAGPAVYPAKANKTKVVYPGKKWKVKKPAEVGLSVKKLNQLSDYAGGFGCVVRHGYMVYTWGDASKRKDVASAAKPIYAHFLFKAVEDGKIASLDARVNKWEPRLNKINENRGHKDRDIKWRHLANQISCYGLTEKPGTAFAYNDWQMALFWDTLFTKVYDAGYKTVDTKVLRPKLTDLLECQDNPTFIAFGTKDRPGRLAISPRDFARFGLFYLRRGSWKGRQLISRKYAAMAVTSSLPNSIPRTAGKEAEMIPGQRSIGSRRIPDNQCDHLGSYSWLWWTNGVDRDGKRHWPDVPVDTYGCFGHGGLRAMVVMPSLDLIISWNDTRIRGREMENRALKLLKEAATSGNGNPKGNPGKNFPEKEAVMWKYVQWSIDDVSYSGNPFDVVARVTFSHGDTGEKHATEMFYHGGKTWKFRFTGTRAGRWTFATESECAQLDGYRGAVVVKENADSEIKGFLTSAGNRYAIQRKDASDLRGYLFNVFMDRVETVAFLEEFGREKGQVEKAAKKSFTDARANGFEIIFVHVNSNWFKFGARGHHEHDSENPDPVTFSVLEAIITTVHSLGGRVHIWAWGDESRKWTPKGVPGAINGESDRRLQRYIAARLGPLPGWTMGYGFDLHEWTNERQLNAWAEYTHEQMGWQHLLCARGHRLVGPHNVNSYDGFGRDVPLATTAHGPKSYAEIVEDLQSDLSRSHLYEERHSYKRRGFDLDMDGTRRLLWWETMAGGMGGFFGFYPDSPHPYPNAEQLRTHYTFWHTKKRFLLDMQRANDLIDGGCALWSASTDSYVFYGENTSQLQVDLAAMKTKQKAVWVDTKKRYEEVQTVTLEPRKARLSAPYRSDWALAVGPFGRDNTTAGRPLLGQIIVDPAHPQWLTRAGGAPFFMCGPGDPEDFLYRGKLNPDGTRRGDQMALIEKLKRTGANCIYLQAVRSHGGDGDRTHNPFVNNDPSKELNRKVLEQWEKWFTEMDNDGIVIYFFLYDDSARIWNTGDEVCKEETDFIRTLVNRFEHHKNLMWCIAEEYEEALSVKRVKRIAAEIRAADNYDHPIAVHKHHGLDFAEFADEPNIDQFAIQYNVPTADALHEGLVKAWRQANGKYNLNMSEAADFGSGRELREKCWACAMGGAYVMILGMDIAGTPKSDLEDCGRLVRFFESTDFCEMSPHDELAYGGTKYVLARPGESYIAYAAKLRGKIGLKNLTAGTYQLRWFDCATGKEAIQENVQVADGQHTWPKPNDIGNELAVYIRRIGEK
jgi:CubicO group peptidase (beta-lactamase class C family)